MLCLLFTAGFDRYALPSKTIEVVVPFAQLKQVAGSSEEISGILNYRGEQIAVIDCGELLAKKPCAAYTDTRIILCQVTISGTVQRIGLLGEQVTQMHRFKESDFKPAAVHTDEIPCTGTVAVLDGKLIQRLYPEKAIPADVLNRLMLKADQ